MQFDWATSRHCREQDILRAGGGGFCKAGRAAMRIPRDDLRCRLGIVQSMATNEKSCSFAGSLTALAALETLWRAILRGHLQGQ